MTAKCAAGHDSVELDYCSVCGAPMPSRAVGAQAPPVTSGASGACPACGEPRASLDARFCEVCRYDFVKAAPARARAIATPANVPVPAPVPATARRWELVLTIDPSLDDEPDPGVPPPPDPERIFAVEIPELLVGRRDDKQNIRPAVPLNDPGASRRHAKFLLNADGTVSLQDLASMNGTKLNGADVVSGSVRPLKR